jgi:hypothetical protein
MKTISFLFTLLVTVTIATGQERAKTPYYISMNSADGSRVHVISDEVLSLQYHDYYGRFKEIPLKIYDSKRSLVATLRLDKVSGLNSFVINLKDIYSGWEMDKIYMCELKDEKGKRYELPFRLTLPPAKQDPLVDIIVNPIQMECNGLQSVVEFFGDVRGGKAPYQLSWYILNESRSDFLYQPRQETIESPGKTMAVTVDKNPEYYVALYVTDACGNTGEKVVNLVCEDKKKKINTIFVEEFKRPPLAPVKIN